MVDVVRILTDSADPKDYWYRLKKRESESNGIELSTFCRQLKLPSSDGKKYETDSANTESMFRIIQSIPSKKAEPFKRWLAKVGYERIQEIENPELAQDRVKEYYELKGYPEDWIDKRLRGIAIRQDLTDEWKTRGIQEKKDFAILTNEISKATFGKTVGEKATTDITISKDSLGFEECKDSAVEGGTIAKNTRKELEEKTGKSVISSENYLHITGNKQKKISPGNSQ